MCCKGYNIMKGYYKNPEATAAIIDENGFLHSGDLGVMDENGYFRITGRIKEMIIRGGENIYPREIENFLYKMPQIEAVEVAGIPSPKYGEEVGAFIKIKEGSSLTRGRSKTVLPGTDRTLQNPEIHLLRQRLSDDRQRQDSEIQAEGRRSRTSQGAGCTGHIARRFTYRKQVRLIPNLLVFTQSIRRTNRRDP